MKRRRMGDRISDSELKVIAKLLESRRVIARMEMALACIRDWSFDRFSSEIAGRVLAQEDGGWRGIVTGVYPYATSDDRKAPSHQDAEGEPK